MRSLALTFALVASTLCASAHPKPLRTFRLMQSAVLPEAAPREVFANRWPRVGRRADAELPAPPAIRPVRL